MSEITVNTVQGIGDLIWVYRKLSPYYDKINLNILCIDESTIQKRAEEFAKTLKNVNDIKYIVVKSKEYTNVAKELYYLPTNNGNYSVNAWLERGIHIDTIENKEVNWNINLQLEENKLPNKYLLVYVSGCSHGYDYYQMSVEGWIKLIVETAKHKRLGECILIGASFDREMLEQINAGLLRYLSVRVITDYSINKTNYVIKNASYFLAYQSGLCMIAEELGTPTFMMWFPNLASMTSAWIRKEHLQNKLFKHGFFGMQIPTLIKMMKD